MEDDSEVIYELIQQKGYAATADISVSKCKFTKRDEDG